MTVTSTTTSVERPGNGSATTFSFAPLAIYSDDQLEVVKRDASGNLTTLELGTGSSKYAVVATYEEESAVTGSIRYPESGGTPLASGEYLVIRRVISATQEMNIENQGGYQPKTLERALDLAAMRDIQLQEQLDRAVVVPFGAGTTPEDYYGQVVDARDEAVAAASTAVTNATTAAAAAAAASASSTAATSSASSAGTSASSASTSATNAASSASSASTSATNAASSASSASTSATNAASSASSASTSATNATSAQVAAEAARDATLAAFDSFDDRYLGTKTSDPTVDNDGNALVAGAIYFNTSSSAMKVYTGSAWVAAYVSGSGYLTAANNLSDLASATTARTNLGLGTIATQASNSVTITGGSVTGVTDIAIADGGTGASTKTAAFDALSPTTTAGDVIYHNGTNNVRLAKGTALQVFRMNAGATAPEWATVSSTSGEGPAFRAKPSTTQTFTNGTATKVTFDSETFDTASCFDSVTNYRFTPNQSGYYRISAQVQVTSLANSKTYVMYIAKNGANTGAEDRMYPPSSFGDSVTFRATDLVYLNGSTDYVEVYFSNGDTFSHQTGGYPCVFAGEYVRS